MNRAYPQYSYPQPQHYQYPPPQPSPDAFRHEYASRLQQLTLNSRPIIQELSLLAQDNIRFAHVVAQCIEIHIRRVSVWAKLPAFYLLDAISKNVFEPYARLFAGFVVPLFLETYRQVPLDTRSKMQEMLLTWRHGAPAGLHLFGVDVQMAIERDVWGSSGTAHEANGFYSGTGQINKAQVLTELEFTLNQKDRAIQANPYDTESLKHVRILHQLRGYIEAGVAQEDLQQILNQLRTLVRPSPVAQPLPPVQPQWAPAYPSYSPPAHMPIQSIPSAPAPAPKPPADITQLLKTLVKAGVVPHTGTLQGTSQSIAQTTPEDPAKASQRAYRRAILSQPITLNSSDILRTRLNVVDFLYAQLSEQCKQCGLRFAKDEPGKRKMENHMDMHFRQNRKSNQNSGRGHSRSWFIGVEDWVHDISPNAKGKGRDDGSRPMNAKAVAAAEAAEREAELRARFVVVPPGDEAKLISCPVCKEVLKSEFLDDDEEWVWKNAILKDDRVYHATCHVEAIASTTSLAARLRTEAAQNSRSATPEANSRLSKSPTLTPAKAASLSSLKTELAPSSSPSSAGVKRKVESAASLSTEGDDAPPMKKLALALTV